MSRVAFLSICLGFAAAMPGQIPGRATVLNPTSLSYEPLMVRNGETVHACGGTSWNGGSLQWIHYARSEDGGRTWPVREVPLALAAEFNGIAVNGDLVVVLVKSPHFGPHTITSTDGGSTWALPVRVSQQSSHNLLREAQLHLDGATVSVAWFEDRPAGRVWFNQSTDGGVTWRAVDQQLDLGLSFGPPPYIGYSIWLLADGNQLSVIWDHDGPGVGEVRHQHSVDGGTTWQPAAGLLATNAGALSADGADGALFVVVLPGPTVWRSIDAGATWQPVTNHGLQDVRSVAAKEQRVVLTAADYSTPSTMSASVSVDGGQNWVSEPSLLVTSRNARIHAHVSATDFFARVAFYDGQAPLGTVIQSDGTPGSWRPLTGDAATAVFAWPDTCLVTTGQLGSGNQHAYVLTGHTPVGVGTPGSGGLIPRLTGDRLPLLGASFTLQLTQARASALGVIGVAFAPPSATPLGGATLQLQSPIVSLSFVTNGAGDHALPVSLPADATLVGLPFTSQAFVLDPVAVDGFSSTAGLETWIN